MNVLNKYFYIVYSFVLIDLFFVRTSVIKIKKQWQKSKKHFKVDRPLTLSSITKYDNVSLQFTTARLITNCDNVLLQFTIAWLFTIVDKCYYNLRRVLQFTTEQALLSYYKLSFLFFSDCLCICFCHFRVRWTISTFDKCFLILTKKLLWIHTI